MIRKVRIYLSLLLFGLSLIELQGQVNVNLTVAADTFDIGEDIPVDIKLDRDMSLQIEHLEVMLFDSLGLVRYLFPEDSTFKDEVVIPVDFEITDYGIWKDSGTARLEPDLSAGNSQQNESAIKLKVWDPGYFMLLIGEVVIEDQYGEEKTLYPPTSQGQLLFIQAPDLTQEGEIEMLPIKDIMREGWHWLDFKWLYMVVGALLLFLFLINRPTRQRKRKAKKIEKTIVIRPAHEVALEKLEELRESELWKKDQIKEFQTRLSFIVREYLENRYGIKALESTTAEINRDLTKVEMNAQDISQLRDLLQIADLVKFAKAKPKEDIHARFLQQAVDFVDRTKKIEKEKETT